MTWEVLKIKEGFQLMEQQELKEIASIGRVFKHLESGATLVAISNNDPHKVFSISFKTPPTDDTGVAHILEHAVCCSSEKYPLKDTFMAFEKGSLCTSFNACTYPDLTMYYGATLHEEDLMHMMDVLTDLVFHPLIYKKSLFFKQEGWHYTLDKPQGNLGYSGVVYHEMLSEYSDPSAYLQRGISQGLFPDTCYTFDSGGIPQDLVTLSEKDFLKFHEQHYQGKNSLLYLYGDGDLQRQLAFLNQVLSHSPKVEKGKEEDKEEVALWQTPFEVPGWQQLNYPALSPKEGEDYLAWSFVIGEAEDAELRLGFEVLEHLLLKSAASPLNKVLIGENPLGKSLEEGGYDSFRRQPTFSIVLKGTHKEKAHLFKQRIEETLTELAEKGIDETLLEASLHTVGFALKEGEYAYEAKGIIYNELILNSLRYEGAPFTHLTYEGPFKRIQRMAKKGYFEGLIKNYLLENPHQLLTVLTPSETLAQQQLEEEERQLKEQRKKFSKEELQAIWSLQKTLEEENQEEESGLIPRLKKEDLAQKGEELTFRKESWGGMSVIYEPSGLQGIVYIHLLFDTTGVLEEDLPYLGLLTQLLTYVGTQKYSADALENAINRLTGGINCSLNTYTKGDVYEQQTPYLKISAKVEEEEIEAFKELMQEIITTTQFQEKNKIREWVRFVHYEMKRSFESAPEYRATKRLFSQLTWAGAYEDKVGGLAYYSFLEELDGHFEEQIEGVCQKLQVVYERVFHQQALTLSLTCLEPCYEAVKACLLELKEALPQVIIEKQVYQLGPKPEREGYMTSHALYTVAQGGNFVKKGYGFHGALYAISSLLESGYLWEKVRLQGGAYGCDLLVDRLGNVILCSYADPHLTETLEVFQKIGDFLRTLTLTQEELDEIIIGTIGALDLPLTTEQKSERALSYGLSGIETQSLERERKEILELTSEQIRAYGAYFQEALTGEALCVIGNAKKLKKHKKLFERLTPFY